MKELPPATLALPPLPRHLDHVCDRFEAAWKAALADGPRPRLEEFLSGIGGPELQTLLLELLGIAPSRPRPKRRCGSRWCRKHDRQVPLWLRKEMTRRPIAGAGQPQLPIGVVPATGRQGPE